MPDKHDHMIEEDETGSGDPILGGARNPFAYAEHKLKENVNWHSLGQPDKKRKLEEAFEMPYEELFDPKNKSPLFVQIDEQTGDMRPCIAIPNLTWGPNPGGSNYTVGTRAFTDPVQGILPDCYLIAALSSLAFLNLIPGKQPPYSYTFYYPPAVEGGTPTVDNIPVPVTNNVPLDGGTYRYSTSRDTGEIWIAMYEKAFARWINRRAGTDNDTPDYTKICSGDPVVALINLSGLKSFRFLTKNFAADGTTIYDKINTVCKTVAFGGVYYRITDRSMVAYTYDPRIEPQPITYSDATIVGNHSYTVLGVHTIGAEKYIVMRNPWGQLDPNPTNLPAGALATGPWYRVADLASSSDAIFALKAKVFRDYFKGFGWVYQ
jgi:Calpain family cysteine protease